MAETVGLVIGVASFALQVNDTIKRLQNAREYIRSEAKDEIESLGVDIVIDDVYFETMGEYGTRAICDKLKSSSDSVNDMSRYDMHILHKDYIESVPAGIIVHGRTWEQWLEEVAQVRRVPRLKHRRGDSMSQLSQHLADHYPITLLGMLKTYIKAYVQELTPGVTQDLRTMSVPCQND